ncbi:hypothetical protein GQ44DRAFT_741901 [Phaeosphaeriaceae sp. PMI808]|nr:hypothetical protein GQ44DRAFT_741901 [Phaeosphaeriaceae sp. PMI808]
MVDEAGGLLAERASPELPQHCAWSVTLASKACNRAAAFVIFRDISITVRNPDGLQQDVNRLVKTLSRTDSARHVQSITIKGALRLESTKRAIYDPEHGSLKQSGLSEILAQEELMDYSRDYVVYDEGVIKESSKEDIAWTPIVSLLKVTTSLRDLIYNCQTQFPPILLKALYQQHYPLCRLHHLTFHFRTLLWGTPYPYEMELATSPSLHRLKATCTYQDSDGDFDYNMDAIMELAAGLAPNLQHVTALSLYPNLPSSQRSMRKPAWQGLPGFTSGAKGSLKSLYLKGSSALHSTDLLQRWAKHTDFTQLEHLVLGGSHTEYFCALSGETMDWIAQHYSFPNLKTLEVYLTRDDVFNARPNYTQHAVSFFYAINPLEKLTINGAMDSQILEAVLNYHGSTLHKLSINPIEDLQVITNGRQRSEIPLEFTPSRIQQIAIHCPHLSDLSLPIIRNASRASETACYKALAQIKPLRALFLTLECTNYRINRDPTYNPQYEGEDNQLTYCTVDRLKRGTVKQTLINSAVDETLARSISTLISTHKRGRQLESLKLWTHGAGQFATTFYGSIDTFVRNLSRSWLIERVPGHEVEEDVSVRELARLERESREIGLRGRDDGEVEKIFWEIWPEKQGKEDWRFSLACFVFVSVSVHYFKGNFEE